MSYATSITDLSRRAATYVDKILKDANPPIRRWSSDEVRADHQSKSSQANRPDDSAECAGQGPTESSNDSEQ